MPIHLVIQAASAVVVLVVIVPLLIATLLTRV